MSFFSKIILFLKGSFSVFQIILGSIGIIFGYQKVQNFIHFLAGIELREDATDFIALKLKVFQFKAEGYLGYISL